VLYIILLLLLHTILLLFLHTILLLFWLAMKSIAISLLMKNKNIPCTNCSIHFLPFWPAAALVPGLQRRSSPACDGARPWFPRPTTLGARKSEGLRRSAREETPVNRAREEAEPANRRAQPSFSPPEFHVDPPESPRPVPSVIWSALTGLGALFCLGVLSCVGW
jgi:hypothetical protein